MFGRVAVEILRIHSVHGSDGLKDDVDRIKNFLKFSLVPVASSYFQNEGVRSLIN